MRTRPHHTVSALGVIARYESWLPVTDATPRITLGEGATPCVPSCVIGERLGLGSLYFKLEGLNPTGSFKDRGMVVAVAKAIEAGARAVICASTGNTSASAAAYAARFGLRAGVVVPAGGIASSKLLQALEDRGVPVDDAVDKPPVDGPTPQLIVLTGSAPRAVHDRAIETLDALAVVREVACALDRLAP